MSSKVRAMVLLGMLAVVAAAAWRKAVERSLPADTTAPVMIAQGSDPFPR
jgi:Tfp pilus assembly protein PilE